MNKCDKTWEYLNGFDILRLTETWIDKEEWKKIKNKVSNKFNWNCTTARKENKKGRARGGITTATKKSLKEIRFREVSQQIVEIKMLYNGNRQNITVYSQNIEETTTEYTQEEKEENLVIRGDYNARTGNRGELIREDKEKKRRRIQKLKRQDDK